MAPAVTSVAINDEGVQVRNPTIRVEEFPSINMHPLFLYVFFDEGSATIPARYLQLTPASADSFSMSSLHHQGTLAIYHRMLNIVGLRLREHPKAKITIVGCNNDAGVERGNVVLSQQRGEAVRNYLRDAWGIDPARMPVVARGLPAKPSNVNDSDGQVENRRAEIECSMSEITDPVITNDTMRTATPPTLEFRPVTGTTRPVKQWLLSTEQNSFMLRRNGGTGTPPSVFEWNINDDQLTIPRTEDPLETQFMVTDSSDSVYLSPTILTNINLVSIARKQRERLGDHETDHYSLILFDFDKSDLGAANVRLADFIRTKIASNSIVTITGYSDRTGDAAHNLKLSQARSIVTSLAVSSPKVQTNVSGVTKLLYPNDLPEGRFFCRTVEIKVETEIKN